MTNNLHNIDTEGRLYTLKCGDGYTCLGFDVAAGRTKQYAAATGTALPDPLPIGTVEAYALYLDIEQQYISSDYCRTHTTFDPNTPPEVQRVLESVRSSGVRIRVFYGHEDGRDWHEENDVQGYVSRTMGPIKAPLLVNNARSSGGSCLLTACIVKIIDTKSKRVLYQHSNYQAGTFEIRPAVDTGYSEGVWIDNQLHAQFKKPGQAARWVRKMRGDAA